MKRAREESIPEPPKPPNLSNLVRLCYLDVESIVSNVARVKFINLNTKQVCIREIILKEQRMIEDPNGVEMKSFDWTNNVKKYSLVKPNDETTVAEEDQVEMYYKMFTRHKLMFGGIYVKKGDEFVHTGDFIKKLHVHVGYINIFSVDSSGKVLQLPVVEARNTRTFFGFDNYSFRGKVSAILDDACNSNADSLECLIWIQRETGCPFLFMKTLEIVCNFLRYSTLKLYGGIIPKFEKKELPKVNTERAFNGPTSKGLVVSEPMINIDGDSYFATIRYECFPDQTFSHQVDAVPLKHLLDIKRSTKNPLVKLSAKKMCVTMGYGILGKRKPSDDTIFPGNQELMQQISKKGKDVMEKAAKRFDTIIEVVDGFLCRKPAKIETITETLKEINAEYKWIKFIIKDSVWDSGLFINGNQYFLRNSKDYIGRGKGLNVSKKMPRVVHLIYVAIADAIITKKYKVPCLETIINDMDAKLELSDLSTERFGKQYFLNKNRDWVAGMPQSMIFNPMACFLKFKNQILKDFDFYFTGKN